MSGDVRNRPATTSDVARLAGVSRATVSHILNGYKGKFSAETETRVREAAAKLDYSPSVVGRVLAKGRSDVLIVMLPPISISLRTQQALDSINSAAERLGLNMLTWFSRKERHSPLAAIRYIKPAAVVDLAALDSADRSDLERANIPLIPSSRAIQAQHSPLPDDLIGEAQLDFLEGRRVVFANLVDENIPWPASLAREDSVRKACIRRGISEPLVMNEDLSLGRAIELLKEVLHELPLGVACYNDEAASAVLAAAQALDLRVPEDVAIVGVDATPLGQLLQPRLTTIDVDREVGLSAVLRELESTITGEPMQYTDLTYAITVVKGGTA